MSGGRSASIGAAARPAPGYSGKPLWQKLGLKPGQRVWLRNAPAQYWDWCGFDQADARLAGAAARNFDFGHVFVTTRARFSVTIRLPRCAAHECIEFLIVCRSGNPRP